MLKRIVLVATMFLGGCSTQLASLAPGATSDKPVVGWSYHLARLDYSLDISRTLMACPEVGADEDPGMEIGAVANWAYSPSDEILLDYQRVTRGGKTGSISLENYPNGTLKSVNAQVSDQTGPAIKEGVGVIVGIGKLAIGPPPVMAAVKAGPPTGLTARVRCTQEAEKQTAALKAATKARDEASKARDEAKAELDVFVSDHAGDATPSDKIKSERAELAKRARETAKAAADAQTDYSKKKEALTFHSRPSVDTKDTHSGEYLVSSEDGGELISNLFAVTVTSGTTSEEWSITKELSVFRPDKADESHAGTAKKALTVFLNKHTVASDFRSIGNQLAKSILAEAKTCSANKGDCGIIYRSPTPARYRVCKDVLKGQCGELFSNNKNILLDDYRNAPQLGGLRSLPLHNGPFENNSLVATFREDSSPVTLTYAKTTSGASGAISAGKDIVAGVGDVMAYRQSKDLRDTNNETALAEAQAKLAEARTKEIEAEIKLREAEERLNGLK